MSNKLHSLLQYEAKKIPRLQSLTISNVGLFDVRWTFKFKEDMIEVPSALPAGLTSHVTSEQAHIQCVCDQIYGRSRNKSQGQSQASTNKSAKSSVDLSTLTKEEYFQLLTETYPNLKTCYTGRKKNLILAYTYEFSTFEESINELGDFRNDLERMKTFKASLKNVSSIEPFKQLEELAQATIDFYILHSRK